MPIRPSDPHCVNDLDTFQTQRTGTVFYKEGRLHDFPQAGPGIFESWKYSYEAGRQVFRADADGKIFEKRLVKDQYGNPKWTSWMEIPDAEAHGVLAIAINDQPLQLPNTDGAIKLQITPHLINAYTKNETYDLIMDKINETEDGSYEYIPWPVVNGIPVDYPIVPEARGPLEAAFPTGGKEGKVYIVEPKPGTGVEDTEDYFIWAMTDIDDPNSYDWIILNTPAGQHAWVSYLAFNEHKHDTNIHLRVQGHVVQGHFVPDLNPDGSIRTERDVWADDRQAMKDEYHAEFNAVNQDIENHKLDDGRHIITVQDPDVLTPSIVDQRIIWDRIYNDYRAHEADVKNSAHTSTYFPHFQQQLDANGNVLFDERWNWNKNISDFNAHMEDTIRHITEGERNKWNLTMTLPTGDKIYEVFEGAWQASMNQYKYAMLPDQTVTFETPVNFPLNPLHEFTDYSFTYAEPGVIDFSSFFNYHANHVIKSIQLQFTSYNSNGNDMEFQVGTNGNDILAVSPIWNSGAAVNPPYFWDIYHSGYITRGLWSATTQYNVGDLVFLNDLKFVALIQNFDERPLYQDNTRNPNWKQVYSSGVSYFDKLVVKIRGDRPLVGITIENVKVVITLANITGVEIGDPSAPPILPLNFVGPEGVNPTYNSQPLVTRSVWGDIVGDLFEQKDLLQYIAAGMDTKVATADINSNYRFDVFRKSLVPSLVQQDILSTTQDLFITGSSITQYDIPSFMPILRDIEQKINDHIFSIGNYPVSIHINADLVANSGIDDSVWFEAITAPLNDPNNLSTPINSVPLTTTWMSSTNYTPGIRVRYGRMDDGSVDPTANGEGYFESLQNNINSPPINSDGTLNSSSWKYSTVPIGMLRSVSNWSLEVMYYLGDKVKYGITYFVAKRMNINKRPLNDDGTLNTNDWDRLFNDWSQLTNYVVNDRVVYQLRYFRSVQDSTNEVPIFPGGLINTSYWEDDGTLSDYQVVSQSPRTSESGPLIWEISPFIMFDQIIVHNVASITGFTVRVVANMSGDITAGRYIPEWQEKKAFRIIGYNPAPEPNGSPPKGIELQSYKVDIGKERIGTLADPDEPAVHEINIGLTDVVYNAGEVGKEEVIRVYSEEIDNRYAGRVLVEGAFFNLTNSINALLGDRFEFMLNNSYPADVDEHTIPWDFSNAINVLNIGTVSLFNTVFGDRFSLSLDLDNNLYPNSLVMPWTISDAINTLNIQDTDIADRLFGDRFDLIVDADNVLDLDNSTIPWNISTAINTLNIQDTILADTLFGDRFDLVVDTDNVLDIPNSMIPWNISTAVNMLNIQDTEIADRLFGYRFDIIVDADNVVDLANSTIPYTISEIQDIANISLSQSFNFFFGDRFGLNIDAGNNIDLGNSNVPYNVSTGFNTININLTDMFNNTLGYKFDYTVDADNNIDPSLFTIPYTISESIDEMNVTTATLANTLFGDRYDIVIDADGLINIPASTFPIDLSTQFNQINVGTTDLFNNVFGTKFSLSVDSDNNLFPETLVKPYTITESIDSLNLLISNMFNQAFGTGFSIDVDGDNNIDESSLLIPYPVSNLFDSIEQINLDIGNLANNVANSFNDIHDEMNLMNSEALNFATELYVNLDLMNDETTALNVRLIAAEADIQTLFGDATALEARVDTIETTNLPGLETDISDLDTRVTDTEDDISDIQINIANFTPIESIDFATILSSSSPGDKYAFVVNPAGTGFELVLLP